MSFKKFALLADKACKIQTDSDKVYIFLFGSQTSSLLLANGYIEVYYNKFLRVNLDMYCQAQKLMNEKLLCAHDKFNILPQVNLNAEEIHEISKSQNSGRIDEEEQLAVSQFKLKLAGYLQDNHNARILKIYHLCDYLDRVVVKNLNFYFLTRNPSNRFH